VDSLGRQVVFIRCIAWGYLSRRSGFFRWWEVDGFEKGVGKELVRWGGFLVGFRTLPWNEILIFVSCELFPG